VPDTPIGARQKERKLPAGGSLAGRSWRALGKAYGHRIRQCEVCRRPDCTRLTHVTEADECRFPIRHGGGPSRSSTQASVKPSPALDRSVSLPQRCVSPCAESKAGSRHVVPDDATDVRAQSPAPIRKAKLSLIGAGDCRHVHKADLSQFRSNAMVAQ
jgi:hypothetical protein